VTITIVPVTGLGEIHPGDDLAALLVDALRPLGPRAGDILVVTQKVVSKAEGAVVNTPTEADYRALVEQEAVAVLRRRGSLAITLTKHGYICANAGVDRSNAAAGQSVMLPANPDRSAHRLRVRIEREFGIEIAVIVTDTFGRAWRMGLVDVAIGVSGMSPLLDLRGTPDMNGRPLEVTEIAIADEVAAAAELALGKASGNPAALVRGVEYSKGEGRAADLVRPPAGDLFR
jgi:coenzyme F420-0:L-glutamate ligase/coenzyme F420-1:gamma-L-glutamate ligase